MRHIMLDIETLGTKRSSIVLSIGLVAFSAGGIVDTQYHVLDVNAQERVGRTIDAKTVDWWMRQDSRAQKDVVNAARTSVPHTLLDIKSFIDRRLGDGDGVWGNGAAFDNEIVKDLFDKFAMNDPWPFWADRCFRTVKSMRGYRDAVANVDKGSYAHNALNDATYQANCLIEFNKAIGGILL